MRLIAHRGFLSSYPENTLQAIEAAIAVADGIELDVRRCGSGELVVIHDETVDRVTDGHGAVSDHTRSDLDALDVLGTGNGVPTLSDALRAVPDHIGVNVELKESGTEADALESLAANHPQGIVSSFHRDVLANCRAIEPAIPRAFITDSDGDDSIGVAAGLDCDYVHPSAELCTDRFVSKTHRSGMSVTAWGIDSPSDVEPLAEVGVDGVIADRPDVFESVTP